MSLVQLYPWLWWSIIAAGLHAVLWGAVAYAYAPKTYPTDVKAGGFTGIVRDTASYTTLGSAAGLASGILAKEISEYAWFQQAMFGILLISITASLLNFFLSAAIDTRKSNDGKSVKMTSRLLIVLHGVIFGLIGTAFFVLLTAVAFLADTFVRLGG